jgi:hypothetical protein
MLPSREILRSHTALLRISASRNVILRKVANVLGSTPTEESGPRKRVPGLIGKTKWTAIRLSSRQSQRFFAALRMTNLG